MGPHSTYPICELINARDKTKFMTITHNSEDSTKSNRAFVPLFQRAGSQKLQCQWIIEKSTALPILLPTISLELSRQLNNSY